MYYEEKIIKGVLHYRTTRDGEWKRVSIETLSSRLEELRQVKKNCQHQSARIRELEGAIEGLLEQHNIRLDLDVSGELPGWAITICEQALNKTEQSAGSVIRRES